MILARSGGNTTVYGIVSGVLGAGGILGGILVAKKKKSKNYVKMIYVSAAVSFLFGDLLMGIGRNVVFWCIAGLAASVPIPFVMAAQRVILYEQVPQEKQRGYNMKIVVMEHDPMWKEKYETSFKNQKTML